MDEFITFPEACKILNRHITWLYKLVRAGKLTRYKRMGEALLKRADVENLLIPVPDTKYGKDNE